MATRTMVKPRLRKERLRLGYTLVEFSKKIDYSYAGYNKAELGRNGIRPKGVKAILNLLGMEFDDLFYFDDGNKNTNFAVHFNIKEGEENDNV